MPRHEFRRRGVPHEGRRRSRAGDQAYGAVVVQDGEIVGWGPSRVRELGEWAGHAEREAMRDAQRRLGRDDLSGCAMYSTSRPCGCVPTRRRAGEARAHVLRRRRHRRGHAMIDHVSIAVSDLSRATRFYEAVLERHRLRRCSMVRGSTVGFGKKYPEFWLNARPEMEPLPANNGAHICLRVRSTDLVDAFHAAALANGGTSDGAPGLRPHDGLKGYYAAFIRDHDNNRIEAVTFTA